MQRTFGMSVGALLVTLAGSVTAAQQWTLKIPEPPADAARVTKDVPFASSGASPLLMDVYRPSAAQGRLPAVIFYTLYWPSEGPSARASADWFKNWSRLAAANGIVAILPDLRAEPGTGNAERPARAAGDDFQRLLAHLTTHAADYGVDVDRIALFAESGATWAALPAVQDPAQTAIKAAVMYYGSANVETFRGDLPLLWVRAGRDSPRTNAEIARLSSLALTQNAPVTVINHPTGRHGFEGRDEDAMTRDVMEQTLSFIKRATSPQFRAALPKTPAS